MMGLRVLEYTCAVQDPSRLWIRGSEQKLCDPGMGDRGRAHRAWFKRHIQRVPGQPFRPRLRTGFPQRKDFRVSCRVAQFAGSIPRNGDNPSQGIDNHRSDRHLTARRGNPRLSERPFHLAAKTDHTFSLHPNRDTLKTLSFEQPDCQHGS